MHLDPTPGRQCAYQNRVVEIDGPCSPSKVLARDVITGEMIEIAIGDLRLVRNRVEETKRDPRFVPRAVWDKARNLASRLAPLSADGSALRAADVARIAKELDVSERTVRRKCLRFMANHRTSDLCPRTCGRRSGSRRGTPQIEAIISDKIQTKFLTREKPTIGYLMEHIRTACREKGLRPPSRSTVTRRIDSITAHERARRRLGRRAAKQKYEPRPGSLLATRPLQIVQIDHTRCDYILVTDDAERTPLGRPWLTVAIDVYTRCILGLLVSFDAPSATSVALCLEQVILPKEGWLRKLNIDANWPMYGRPEILLLDNGSDFHSEALMRGCAEYGITLQYRPVKEPHFGGHIERLIGTLMGRVHLLPGTTFSNPKARGDYDSAARAIFTLGEFRGWLIDQVTRWYHVRGHAGLGGIAPTQAWDAAWKADGQIRVPPVVASPMELRAAFLPVVWRTVQRTGIEFSRIRYWHDALEPLIGSEEKLCVRYDPRDVRQVLARGPDGTWLEIPAVSPDVHGISLWEHKWRGKERRKLGDNEILQAERAEGVRRHNAAVDEAAQRTRTARRRKAITEQRRADGIPDDLPAAPATPSVAAPELDGPRVKPTVEVWPQSDAGGVA
jgi:putative transposase